MSPDGFEFVQPIQADRPCGESLEDTQLMASLDAYQLFGQPIALDPEPDWQEVKGRALEALARSKDLRVLAHLSAAVLRTDGIQAFFETLTAASQWLELYWADVYPLVEEDAVVRRNALSGFADQNAILDALRRAPLVNSRQHGRFSLRDIEVAAGQVPSAEGEEPPDALQIGAAFSSVPLADLLAVQRGVTAAIAGLKDADARMRSAGGPEAAPTVDHLLAQLARIDGVVRTQMSARPDGAGLAAGNAPASPLAGVASPAAVGAVRSRQDAIRAMEAVADFFRQNEPSSPVPLLLERATRLVSKNFLEVLADMAPDGVAQARSAGGLRTSE